MGGVRGVRKEICKKKICKKFSRKKFQRKKFWQKNFKKKILTKNNFKKKFKQKNSNKTSTNIFNFFKQTFFFSTKNNLVKKKNLVTFSLQTHRQNLPIIYRLVYLCQEISLSRSVVFMIMSRFWFPFIFSSGHTYTRQLLYAISATNVVYLQATPANSVVENSSDAMFWKVTWRSAWTNQLPLQSTPPAPPPWAQHPTWPCRSPPSPPSRRSPALPWQLFPMAGPEPWS